MENEILDLLAFPLPQLSLFIPMQSKVEYDKGEKNKN